MNAHNPAAEKFQVTQVPMVAPARCCVCGAVDRPVVDFGMSLDYYGAVLFCVECVGTAARAIGYAPVAEIDQLREHASRIASNYTAIVDLFGRRVNDVNKLVASLPGDIERLILADVIGYAESPWEEHGAGGEDSPGAIAKPEFDFESGPESS